MGVLRACCSDQADRQLPAVFQVSPMALGARMSRSRAAARGGKLRPGGAVRLSQASLLATARSATPGGHRLASACAASEHPLLSAPAWPLWSQGRRLQT